MKLVSGLRVLRQISEKALVTISYRTSGLDELTSPKAIAVSTVAARVISVQ